MTAKALTPAAPELRVAVADINNPQAWANAVWNHVAKTAEEIIETGRTLRAAKVALEHGEWLKMFAQKPSTQVPRPLPFGEDKAQRLMAISEHPVLTRTAHVRYLPAHWSTLAELTKVPDEKLEQAFAKGRITPEMEREEAIDLQPEVPSPSSAKTRRKHKEAEPKIKDLVQRAEKLMRSIQEQAEALASAFLELEAQKVDVTKGLAVARQAMSLFHQLVSTKTKPKPPKKPPLPRGKKPPKGYTGGPVKMPPFGPIWIAIYGGKGNKEVVGYCPLSWVIKQRAKRKPK